MDDAFGFFDGRGAIAGALFYVEFVKQRLLAELLREIVFSLGAVQHLSFLPEVIKKQICGADGERGKCAVVDFAVANNKKTPPKLFQRFFVVAFGAAARHGSAFLKLFSRQGRIFLEDSQHAARGGSQRTFVGTGCGDQRRKKILGKKCRAPLVPFCVNDFAASGKLGFHVPHVGDTVVGTGIPLPTHFGARVELRPKGSGFCPVLERVDKQDPSLVNFANGRSNVHGISHSHVVAKEAMKYSMPAEWELHEACWVAWPCHADLWREDLGAVQEEATAFFKAISHAPRGEAAEKLNVLVPDAKSETEAKAALAGLPAQYHKIPFGDVWLRDTGPIFVWDHEGNLAAQSFWFNGWGDKYDLPYDKEVGQRITTAFGGAANGFAWILEGGSIEVDGEGTCLTTEQCLLNPNRNRGFSREKIEGLLKESLGAEKTLWLGEGLINDHTDGHIDTLARFTAPGKVVCMEPNGAKDPNAKRLSEIEERLRGFKDAQGRTLEVATIPSPGLVKNSDGDIMPASYVNFYISNHSVIVPTYGVASDKAAVEAIGRLFPGRRTIGLSARAYLAGGGAFHCVTQQQPKE